MMLPPAPIRRLLLVPLVIVIGATLAVLAAPVALLSAAYNLIRQDGPAHRSRLLRVIFLGLAWSAGETATLTASFGLWLVSGFGGRMETEPYQNRNYAVMARFLDLAYRAVERACHLTVTVAGPPEGDLPPADRPVIVISRHAGPGDSLLLIHYLLSVCQRRPRVVMKSTLQLDPSLDIVANRVPNAFLRRVARSDTTAGLSHTRLRTEQVRRLAAGMGPGSALVIFPEGGNWTPLRWRKAPGRLRRAGRPDLAERAAAMPNVLPPHGSGTLAAIAACPEADVVFVAHTGLDRLVSVRDVWRSLHFDLELRARWWWVPADSVPHDAGRDTQVAWLYDWWERIDAWITSENGEPASPAEPAELAEELASPVAAADDPGSAATPPEDLASPVAAADDPGLAATPPEGLASLVSPADDPASGAAPDDQAARDASPRESAEAGQS
jgi:1-acyl-sn-glycerol-3-phosphate acyltransferase